MSRTLGAVVIASLFSPLSAGAAQELEDAHRAFYNAQYESAAALTLAPCLAGSEEALAACELRSAALLFQIKRALGEAADKDKAWKQCAVCPELMSAFQRAVARGQTLARVRLERHPDDRATLFLLGKINLNHVWLLLGTLGRKTGWSEYWEGRRALDKVLKVDPGHVRARVARGWIDYVVDTKMPRGTRWLLGGGNKKRGLLAVRQAAEAEADFFTRAEARFALWDMQVRERDLQQAVVTARALSRDFPDNQELNTFLKAHHPSLPH
nr:TPR repeat-containing protein [uncultured bacterium]